MNLAIVGCCTAGKNYISLLINKNKINKTYIIDENLYILKLIHSMYNSIFKERKFSTVRQK